MREVTIADCGEGQRVWQAQHSRDVYRKGQRMEGGTTGPMLMSVKGIRWKETVGPHK